MKRRHGYDMSRKASAMTWWHRKDWCFYDQMEDGVARLCCTSHARSTATSEVMQKDRSVPKRTCKTKQHDAAESVTDNPSIGHEAWGIGTPGKMVSERRHHLSADRKLC